MKIMLLFCAMALPLSGCSQAGPPEKPAPSVPTVDPLPGSPAGKAVDVSWRCTTESAPWKDMGTVALLPGSSKGFAIDASSLGQVVEGFGGAFNEKGWEALSLLSPSDRDTVVKDMFDPVEGAKFNICRVPIGASDYAVSRYTLDETKNDYEMKHFSIERDKQYLLPYIRAAMQYQPGLKVWGSDWTPPPWMKTNGAYDGGYMKDDPAVYRAYALYLARFVEAYRAEGIDLFAVAVQNEPEIETHYPSCLWTPAQFKTFVKDYMGPLFAQRNVKADIMFGTIQGRDFSLYPVLLDDPGLKKYVSIIGFQWDGLASVSMAHIKYPGMRIYQTETECGNCHWKPGFDPDKPQNDWAYGVYTWDKIKSFFDGGVSAYMLWNMVLDEEGKSIDAQLPWPQNAAIVVNKHTKKVTYTPMFYAFKHFTYYVSPGARYVEMGDREDVVAFSNPDGSLVIELQNQTDKPRDLSIDVAGGTLSLTLPANSWNTLVVPKD